MEGKEQYQVNFSSKFLALENFDDDVNINRILKNIGENINISAKENVITDDVTQSKV